MGGFVGFLAAVLAGAIESIGDYFACAKLAGAPPPPKLVLNYDTFTDHITSCRDKFIRAEATGPKKTPHGLIFHLIRKKVKFF